MPPARPTVAFIPPKIEKIKEIKILVKMTG
jgi:hypothetical protein